MHELALAESVLAIVAQAAQAHAACHVRTVRVTVGALAHVDPDALRFCFDVAKRRSVAAEATLDIERPPGTAWCMPCGASVTVAARADPCPRCGSYQLQVQGGEELRVRDIEIG